MDADAHLLEIPRFPAVRIAREAPLAARFVRRYKRFLADVEVKSVTARAISVERELPVLL